MPAHPQPIEERLARYSIPEPNTGCVIWLGALSGPASHRYGYMYHRGKVRGAHVVAYELANGAVPDGLVLDHKCRMTVCINPDHLEPVTQGENIARGLAKEGTKARFAARTHFKCGHAIAPENTYVVGKRRERRCRSCNKADALRRWREKQDA
jgi:hypothetical protein